MTPEAFQFSIALADFDLSKLPFASELLRSDPKLLTEAITRYYVDFFRPLGGHAAFSVSDDTIQVAWNPGGEDPLEAIMREALRLLRKQDYRSAQVLLQALHARFPDDQRLLYNYGMLLSDQGKLDEAEGLLRRLAERHPSDANGWTALGVVLSRQHRAEEAVAAFRRALAIDASNSHALRNLGALVAKTSPADALSLFEQAVSLSPEDTRSLFAMGQCLYTLERLQESDGFLKRCIELEPLSEVANQARGTRTLIAERLLRKATDDRTRPDAILYCLSALKRFRALGMPETKAVVLEIAMLGRSGLDINDPEPKYTLKSLAGKFSGLQLVSYMYTGLKLFAPEQDPGIDLSKEYGEAQALLEKGI